MDFLILFLGAETSIVELNYQKNFQIWHIVYQHELFSLLYIQYLPYEKKLLIYYYLEQSNKELFVIIIKIKFEAVFS